MQIKRHWLLVETMPFEYFFSGVYTPSGCYRSSARRLDPRAAAPLTVARISGHSSLNLLKINF